MFTNEVAHYIAAVNFDKYEHEYVVILDLTEANVKRYDLSANDYRIVYHGNEHAKAVAVKNFWKNSKNVHFVHNDSFKLQVVNVLADNDLTVPTNHKIYNEFKNLSARDLIAVMSQAAKLRVNQNIRTA